MSKQSLKSGWQVLRFDQFAENIADRIDPEKAETNIYVGLEHLSPETIHLRQWGHPSDVIGQKLVFKKGDVIFGRRRAYQRKLALAEFDGICSAHAMVVRAKPQWMLPEFLPFFLQSDMFMERAIGISVGSLSPTINWKTLRVQEFPIPPLSEQKRIAEILWAADEAVERNNQLKQHCEELYYASIERYLFDDRNTRTMVSEFASINATTLSESKTPKEFCFKYLDIGSVTAPKIIGPMSEYTFFEAPSRARRVVNNGDILLSTVRPNLQSFVRINNLKDKIIASTGFAVISPKRQYFRSVLFHAFFSKRFTNFCEAHVTGTNYPAISARDIGKFKVCIPEDINEIKMIGQRLNVIEKSIDGINLNIQRLRSLGKSLNDQLLGFRVTHD